MKNTANTQTEDPWSSSCSLYPGHPWNQHKNTVVLC